MNNNQEFTFNNIKIALGCEIKDGPWGGANRFLLSFKEYFKEKGARVVHQLEDGVDLAIIINVRKESGTFGYRQALRHKRRYPKSKIIFRINDTDKTGKIYKIDKLRLKTSRISDGVVFVSNWTKDYYMEKGFNKNICHAVIRNGVSGDIFNRIGHNPWDGQGPMKIITHHWSDNLMKGWDIYQHLDELLADPWMRQYFEFTFIGRIPQGIKLNNTRCVPVLTQSALASELKKNHVYLTASRWESGPMHPLEGMACGLPVLFIDEGGGSVEYCNDFGIKFKKDNFTVSLFKMLKDYHALAIKMENFSQAQEQTNRQYEELFLKLLKE